MLTSGRVVAPCFNQKVSKNMRNMWLQAKTKQPKSNAPHKILHILDSWTIA
jgi:hypothetical protein